MVTRYSGMAPNLKLVGDGSGVVHIDTRNIGAPLPSGCFWTVDGVPYAEAGATNLCLHSEDLANAAWLQVSGAKTQIGTVKSPGGDRDIPLYQANALGLTYQNIAIGGAGDYTLSFWIYGNHQQVIATAAPDSASSGGSRNYRDVTVSPQWKRVVLTGTFAGAGTLRVVFETRNASAIATKPIYPDDFGIAITDIQVESGTVATSYIKTEGSTAARAGGVTANSPYFHVRTADVGKTIKFNTPSGYISPSVTFVKKYYALCVGQSNVFYQWKLDRTIDFIDPKVKQIGRRNGYFGNAVPQVLSGVTIPFDNPSHFNETLSSGTPENPNPNAYDRFDSSWAGWFGNMVTNIDGIEIIFFNEAQGGAGYVNNSWGVGDTLYNSLVSRVNAFTTTYPTAECKFILSAIKEADSASGISWASFKADYLAMMAGFRGLTGAANAPIIELGISTDWQFYNDALVQEYLTEFRKMNDGTFGLTDSRFIDTDPNYNGGNVFESNKDVFGSDPTHFSKLAGYKIANAAFNAYKEMRP